MPHSSFPSKTDLIQLYSSGLSMRGLSQKLNCSEHKITYWMQKYQISRRSRSDAAYVQANPTGDPFKIKTTFSSEESKLLGTGLGIYWGEGEKVSPHYLRVANTDYKLIKTFRKFLRDICQLEERKISYSLICFNDSNIDKVKFYWSNHLSVLPEKFGKIVQIPTQGKGTYRKKSEYGVCTISVSNIKLKTWIMKEIENLYTA